METMIYVFIRLNNSHQAEAQDFELLQNESETNCFEQSQDGLSQSKEDQVKIIF